MHEIAIVDSYVVVCSKWRQVALVGTPDIDPWPNCKGLSGKIALKYASSNMQVARICKFGCHAITTCDSAKNA
jgi:hypothetical protein